MAQADMHRSNDGSALLAQLVDEEYCYLTTTGRVSGRPHEIEIWFGLQGNSLYLLSGGMDRSDWVKNLRKTPAAVVRIAGHTFTGVARSIEDQQEEQMARQMLAEKYQGWRPGGKLSDWARNALPVAIDLSVERS